MHFADLLRLLRINFILLRHGLDELAFALPAFRPLRFLLPLMPWRWLPSRSRDAPTGERVRRALEDLGPIFVKFGQILSTRRDVVPADIADQLALLQDRVPPFPAREARKIVEQALMLPVDQAFKQFDDAPLASASIAQVHAAELLDGREVVVKIVRPGIAKAIRRDLRLMYLLAEIAERFLTDARRLRPVGVVAEYEKTILDELDLVREGGNASQLRRNFEDSSLLYIPEVYWPYTRENVLVMERIDGIAITDRTALRQAGIDLRMLAERGVEIFFTQVFEHNFFHADMHPGNIFVSRDLPQEPRYIAVDFGIVGTLSPADQSYLAANFVAFFRRDYRRVAELHLDSGWVPATTRVNELEAAIRTVCEPIFERPLREISFGKLLYRLLQTARRFNMHIQPQLVLLQKTLLNVEGLGRQLYPDLDIWTTSQPFIERQISSRIGVQAVLGKLRTQLPEWADKLPRLPGKLDQALTNMCDGRLSVELHADQLRALHSEVRNSDRRHLLGQLAGTLVIVAAVLYVLPGALAHSWLGVPWVSWGALVLALFIYYRAWFGIKSE